MRDSGLFLTWRLCESESATTPTYSSRRVQRGVSLPRFSPLATRSQCDGVQSYRFRRRKSGQVSVADKQETPSKRTASGSLYPSALWLSGWGAPSPWRQNSTVSPVSLLYMWCRMCAVPSSLLAPSAGPGSPPQRDAKPSQESDQPVEGEVDLSAFPMTVPAPKGETCVRGCKCARLRPEALEARCR